ncbi:sugar ABC transporter substrate-binding protein [Cohnella lubricantis]|uniref:Sugar ABC transporter substrate-binding protein n=1 Tax=Cohnella lubricantis TaxID=2163172 RepID=A0A841TA71_9BACL|nr:sugar ABC transporter substrate-binding protein [Cohnella lubricantis]MBB6678393.1 sugar ABC transporter substrate-binding protein [Cohnella lubricantis]MBP2116773.1 multiple sugar transport system substrate-binding protein [Cohnella lubricantis]
MKKAWRGLGFAAIALTLVLQMACGSSNSNGGGNAAGESAQASSENGGKKVKLKFWDFHTEKEEQFFRDLVDEYNKSQNEVEIEYSTYDQTNYTSTKLPTGFASGDGPDIYMISPGDFMKFANSGLMADLTPYFPEGAKEDFLPASLDAVTVDGKILALPYELELLGLYYNEDMLKNAGVEVPKTWDELYDAAKKLTTNKVAGLVLPPDKGAYFNFVWYPFLWQQGGNVLSEDGTKSTFNTPEAAKALDFWGSFFRDGLSPTKLQQGPTEIDNLGSQGAAMQVAGTWAITRAEEVFGDVPINVAPLPIPEGGKAATDAGGWKFAVNGKSEHVEEAAKFVMWAFADDPARALKWCTEIKFAYSPRQSVVEQGEAIYNKGMRKVFTEEIYDSAIPEPRYPSEVLDVVGEAIQNVMFGKYDGAQAVQEADGKINEALQAASN